MGGGTRAGVASGKGPGGPSGVVCSRQVEATKPAYHPQLPFRPQDVYKRESTWALVGGNRPLAAGRWPQVPLAATPQVRPPCLGLASGLGAPAALALAMGAGTWWKPPLHRFPYH